MEPQTVTVWPASLHEVVIENETPFKLLDSKANFIARAAWWLLEKMDALEPYFEKVSKWTFVPHEQRDLIKAMQKAVDYDMRYIRDGKAVFIIGGKTFSELTGSPAFRDQMRFVAGNFTTEDPYRGRQIFGVPVHVVPNMVGMAVVPRAIIERTN
jgi:hypothetical protein